MLNRIIVGDALEELRKMRDGTVQGVVTSPPYNLLNSSGNGMKHPKSGRWKNAALMDGYGVHDDAMPHEEYVRWQRDVLTECMRVVDPAGVVFYNHKWRVQRGRLQDRADIVDGFPVRQVIIWKRSGGFNFNPGYFVPTYEVVYMLAKPAFRLPSGMNGLGDVWEIRQDTDNDHPAPFPVELARRCCAAVNGTVLDPFMGSGTTAIGAELAGHGWLGIEKNEAFAKRARVRIRKARAEQQELFDAT